MCWNQEKCKDFRDFDKGQMVMTRWLGDSISITAVLVGSSQYAKINTYTKSGLTKDTVMGAQDLLMHMKNEG